jgi:hypothetical protein
MATLVFRGSDLAALQPGQILIGWYGSKEDPTRVIADTDFTAISCKT